MQQGEVQKIEDVKTDADNNSPRGVIFVGLDGKCSPTFEEAQKRTAILGVSIVKKHGKNKKLYFEDKYLAKIGEGFVETGYQRVILRVGGYLLRHNYLLQYTLQQAKANVKLDKEIRDLDSEGILALDRQLTEESEKYGREQGEAWVERNQKFIAFLKSKNIEVVIEPWEDILKTEEYQSRRAMIDSACTSAQVRKADPRKKELARLIGLATDQMFIHHQKESDNERYIDALETHQSVYKEKVGSFVKEESGVIPKKDDNGTGYDYFYPMEFNPISVDVAKGLEKVAEIEGTDFRVFSVNFRTTSPKAHPKNGRRKSDEGQPPSSDVDNKKGTKEKGSAHRAAATGDLRSDTEETLLLQQQLAKQPPFKKKSSAETLANLAAARGTFVSVPPVQQTQPVPIVGGRHTGKDNSTSPTDSGSSGGTSPTDGNGQSSVVIAPNGSNRISPSQSASELGNGGTKPPSPDDKSPESVAKRVQQRLQETHQAALRLKLATVALEEARNKPEMSEYGLALADSLLCNPVATNATPALGMN